MIIAPRSASLDGNRPSQPVLGIRSPALCVPQESVISVIPSRSMSCASKGLTQGRQRSKADRPANTRRLTKKPSPARPTARVLHIACAVWNRAAWQSRMPKSCRTRPRTRVSVRCCSPHDDELDNCWPHPAPSRDSARLNDPQLAPYTAAATKCVGLCPARIFFPPVQPACNFGLRASPSSFALPQIRNHACGNWTVRHARTERNNYTTTKPAIATLTPVSAAMFACYRWRNTTVARSKGRG